MIPSFNGSVVTPSAVGVDESGNLVIGEKAKAQFIMAPERTVIEVKRLRQQYQKDYDKQEKFISGGIIMRGIPTGVRHR